MKVILLQDVLKVGKKGELIEVSDGYARNVLIKKKQAMEATKQSINELQIKNKAEEKRRQQELEEAKQLRDQIKEMQVTVSVKAGAGGKVFGSVSSSDIAAAAREQLKIDLNKKKIVLKENLKEVGEHKVALKIHPKVSAELKVIVTQE